MDVSRTRERTLIGNVRWIESEYIGRVRIGFKRPMHGGIGCVIEFTQQKCPKHRLEGFTVRPLGVRILLSVCREVEVADHPGNCSIPLGQLTELQSQLLSPRIDPVVRNSTEPAVSAEPRLQAGN
jgi:hypothetical protein